jgi:hypothetical protein
MKKETVQRRSVQLEIVCDRMVLQGEERSFINEVQERKRRIRIPENFDHNNMASVPLGSSDRRVQVRGTL